MFSAVYRISERARQFGKRAQWLQHAMWIRGARLKRAALHQSTGAITADPNPTAERDCSGIGLTTLSWASTRTETVEVHVDAPEGPLFSRTGPSGSATTGKWVIDGRLFYLQDVSAGRPLTPSQTLATVRVRVSPADARTPGQSIIGQWDYQNVEPFCYGDDTTYQKGIAFLDGHGTIEDWGCGFAHAKKFVQKSRYIGIDGSRSEFSDKVADLREYTSKVDCILMRHVLEHNYDWRKVLANAVASFKKRMVLIIFTPLTGTTRRIALSQVVTSSPVPDISFRREDLTEFFKQFRYTEESLETDTQYSKEHIFYIEK